MMLTNSFQIQVKTNFDIFFLNIMGIFFAGGAIGIFVGISFWSLYVDTFGPLFEWLEKRFLQVLSSQSVNVKIIDVY